MAKVRLVGDAAGYTELSAPPTAGNNTITLPTGNGSANQLLKNTSVAGELGWSSLVEDASGRLLIGNSSARSNIAGFSQTVQIEGTTAATSSLALIRNQDANTPASNIYLAKSRSTSNGGNTTVASGDTIGVLNFHANDGVNFIAAATVAAFVDGTPGTNDMPGRLTFSTTADGASSTTERMRIDSSGNVGIGTTSPTQPLTVRKDQDASTFLLVQNSSTGVNAVSAITLQSTTKLISLSASSAGDYFAISSAGTIGTQYQDFNTHIWRTTGGVELARLTSTGFTLASGVSPYTITVTATGKTLANRERCTITASGQTLTLPASPGAGDEVAVTIAGTFLDTVIARNGSNIMSLAEDMTLDKPNVSVTLYYVDATRGWRLI